MIPRYSLPEMAGVWSDAHRLEVWKEVEALAMEAWVGLGVAPKEAAVSLREAPVPSPEEVEERERLTDHDLAGWTRIGQTLGGQGDSASLSDIELAHGVGRVNPARLFPSLASRSR